MIPRIATIVLLVEDANQEKLLRRCLQEMGQSNRNMRINKTPKGTGSGEQHVREQYAAEVRALRARLGRTRSCLIAMIDADTGTTDSRRAQFKRALQDADEGQVQNGEPILDLVARRNVETWILCLNGESVDEETDYHDDTRVTHHSIKQAAHTLYEWTRPNVRVPDSCVPSLEESLPEFDRIPT